MLFEDTLINVPSAFAVSCRLPFQQDVDFGNATSHLGDCDGKSQQHETEASGCASWGEDKLPLATHPGIASTLVNENFRGFFCKLWNVFCKMVCKFIYRANESYLIRWGFRFQTNFSQVRTLPSVRQFHSGVCTASGKEH